MGHPVSIGGRLSIVAGTFFLVMAPVRASSQDLVKQLTECARIPDPAQRLSCYDALARESSAASDTDGSARKWGVSTKIDPIDDAKTVTLYLEAATTEPPGENAAFLFLRCRRGETNVYITWSRPLANGEVMVRLGKEAAERQYWNLSTDNEATFYAGDPVTFIRSLMASDRLVAQVDLKGEGNVTALFELEGLSGTISPLRSTCGW